MTEWGRGYHEEPEEDWRNRGYAEPEEEWRGYGYDHDHGYGHDHGHREEEEEDDRRREGEGGGGGYQYSEPEDEPRVTPDESLFRWLAISYASTHLTMTHNHHSSCHGDSTGAHGIINRAKWQPVTGSE